MNEDFYIMLFPSVNHTMKAEKFFKSKKISFKLIPIPKKISSSCGVCLRFTEKNIKTAVKDAEGEIEFNSIIPLD